MKFIDLFAGIGGFRYGLENCNQKRRAKRVRGKLQDMSTADKSGKDRLFRCVYSNEWDKYAAQIYKKHYGEINTKDIRTVKADEIPDHDLLCAGFPCQAFSVAGKRLGFEDTRGTLFFEIARIAKHKRPRYLLLENVKGLLSHEQGKTFQTIIGVLADLGYRVEWQVLNSKHFGVPQNRERVFIVGHLGGGSGSKVFPIKESGQSNLKYSGGVISAREQWLKDGKMNSRNFSQGQRIYSDKGISQTLAGNAGGQGGKTGLYAVRWARTEKGKKARSESQKKGKDYTPFNKGHRELVRAKEQISGCVTHAVNKDSLLEHSMRIRRVTPTECERLQGFPDGWTEGISDTQRYKCLGNAVTTTVISTIGERLNEKEEK